MKGIGKLQHLLSPDLNDSYISDIIEGAAKYEDDLPCFSALKSELTIWKGMWNLNPEKMPQNPSQAYKFADSLPNIQFILQLLCTLPLELGRQVRQSEHFLLCNV